jgi:hypothetical protein
MIDDNLLSAITRNADYSQHSAAQLTEDEVRTLNGKVETELATTNGDCGSCEISTRQLALLLAAAVQVPGVVRSV